MKLPLGKFKSGNDAYNKKEKQMDNDINVLEEFNISELEDRVEFGLCGGSGGGGGGGGGGSQCEPGNCPVPN